MAKRENKQSKDHDCYRQRRRRRPQKDRHPRCRHRGEQRRDAPRRPHRHKKGLEWETAAAGRVGAPNWNGCVTQLGPRGDHGGVGFKGRYALADATDAAVGGWDIRPTPLGDALYESLSLIHI